MEERERERDRKRGKERVRREKAAEGVKGRGNEKKEMKNK